MKPAVVVLATASLPGAGAWAQRHVDMDRPHLNPNMSLSAPTNNPLQDQVREDYAAQLQAQQRELLQQNPSGVTRQELEIGNQLNGYVPR
jgi:hypothetical protein